MAVKHGKILALFAFTYKTVQCLLSKLRGKMDPLHSFIGGVIGSTMLIKFDTDAAINRQIGYYLAGRVMEGILVYHYEKLEQLPEFVKSYRFVLSVSWGIVMMLWMQNGKLL